MQHTGVAQDDEALIKAIAIAIRVVENLLAPVTNRVADLATERVDGHRIDERCRVWSSQHDPMLTYSPPNDERITVIGSHRRLASVIQIPERPASLVRVTENRH